MLELFGIQLGTVFQGGTLAAMLAILALIVRWQLGLKKLNISARQVDVRAAAIRNKDVADRRDHIAEEMKALRENVARLREELHTCEEECRDKIEKLTKELWGEKRQRVQEQISLINTIISTVDAPQLSKLLRTLESIQGRMDG